MYERPGDHLQLMVVMFGKFKFQSTDRHNIFYYIIAEQKFGTVLKFEIQWCPDISPGPVQPDNGTIRGMGHKTVLLPLRCILLK